MNTALEKLETNITEATNEALSTRIVKNKTPWLRPEIKEKCKKRKYHS